MGLKIQGSAMSMVVVMGLTMLKFATLPTLAIAAPGSSSDDKPAAKGAPTFNKDIAPILFQNCASCHRPGEVAPFPLLSYADVQKRAPLIATVTAQRIMPPWKADEGIEKFHDARRLTDEQIAMIQQWAKAGAPQGKVADLPPAPKFASGWSQGEPDAIFEPDESYTLGAEGNDVYRCFVIPTSYTEDRWVSAMEVRPGNRAVVHHVIVYLDTKGKARALDAADPGPGYTSFGGIGFTPEGSLGGWAPGNLPRRLPDGTGIKLPKGADIVLQVHYHRSGKEETDRTKIGLYFSKGPVDQAVHDLPLVGWPLHIPPGEKNYEVKGSFTSPIGATILRVTPHMHLIGHDMTVTATLPDGTVKKLVAVPDWDFNWQTTYTLQEPLHLPAGSTVSLVAHYDNSDTNPRNPSNPPKLVTFGEKTTDEMCFAFIDFTIDGEHIKQSPAAPTTAPTVGAPMAGAPVAGAPVVGAPMAGAPASVSTK